MGIFGRTHFSWVFNAPETPASDWFRQVFQVSDRGRVNPQLLFVTFMMRGGVLGILHVFAD